MAFQWIYLANLKGPPGDWLRNQLLTGTDLDALKTPGMYPVGTFAVANSLTPALPAGSIGGGTVEVLGSGNYVTQRWLATGATIPSTWVRDCRNGTWTAWRSMEWVRPPLTNGTGIDTLTTPGLYPVPTFAIAASLFPAVPSPGGGVLEVTGDGAVFTVQQWRPAGASTTLNPVYQREKNPSGWTSFHRVDAGATDTSRVALTAWGDSLTEGSDVSGVWPATDAWPAKLAPALPGVTVTNNGRSGDTMNEILLRAGALELWVSVVGGSIPASGSVAVTTSQVFKLRDNRSFGCTIAGVSGTLVHLTNETWQFNRYLTGAVTNVSGKVKMVSNFSGKDGEITIIWGGRNDVTLGKTGMEQSVADHVVAGYQAAVEWLAPRMKHIAIAGVTTATDEPAGSARFLIVKEINDRLRAMYPGKFADVQSYLVNKALADMGLTPTAADTAATNAGTIPPQLYATGDNIHFSKAAAANLATKFFAPYVLGKGWA